MNGRAFANDCPITDATQTSRTVIAVILRRSADAGEWVDDALSPDVGVSNPASMRSAVVLPQPEGPRKDRNSPARIDRFRSSAARTSPKRFVTPRSSAIGLAVAVADGGVYPASLII